jgi:homoserine dehydrogenase
MHVITANKGPVAIAYRELAGLAERQKRKFYFESSVMDGAPIFSLFRNTLPSLQLKGFFGILNSCTNMILTRMEAGETFDQAVVYCQSIGIAETDPSSDVDGWDAAIKVAALASVLMGVPTLPHAVDREGIRAITPEMIEDARREGKRWKLMCSAGRSDGHFYARVHPEKVPPESPCFSVNGTSSYVQFETDVLPGLGIVESNPGPNTTAFGLLADLIDAVKD